MDIIVLENRNTELRIAWLDGLETLFRAVWLRDNCCCADCGEASINRCKLRLSEIDLDVEIENANLVQVDNLARINIEWSDGHSSGFDSQWLRDNTWDANSKKGKKKDRCFTNNL